MKTSPTSLNRTITGTAAAVLILSLMIGLIPHPPKTRAHTQTKPGTIGQKITYAFGRPVKYKACARYEDTPFGRRCLKWKTKVRMEKCSGPGSGCNVINTYTHLTCTGFWVGSACREPVKHRHLITTTTRRVTTTTRAVPVTTTTRPAPTTATTQAPTPPSTRVTRPRPVQTTTTTRSHRPTNPTTTRRVTTTTTRRVRVTTTTRPRPTTTTTTVVRRTTTTTTTTRPRPTTTTTTRSPRPSYCLPPSPQDVDAVRDRFGWESGLERPQGLTRGVAGGDEIPVGEGPTRLFVTSNKLVESAAAEPKIWPTVPEGITVTSTGVVGSGRAGVNCLWKLRSVRSEWRELLVWQSAERAKISRAAPELLNQWRQMGAIQQAAVRNRHRSSGVGNPPDVMCEVGQMPETDCAFFVSHPSVWEWRLWGTFWTDSSVLPEEHVLLLQNGVSRLWRLIDYTSSTTGTCTGDNC